MPVSKSTESTSPTPYTTTTTTTTTTTATTTRAPTRPPVGDCPCGNQIKEGLNILFQMWKYIGPELKRHIWMQHIEAQM